MTKGGIDHQLNANAQPKLLQLPVGKWGLRVEAYPSNVDGTPGKRQSLRASFDGNIAKKITMDTNCGMTSLQSNVGQRDKIRHPLRETRRSDSPIIRAITSRYIAVKGD